MSIDTVIQDDQRRGEAGHAVTGLFELIGPALGDLAQCLTCTLVSPALAAGVNVEDESAVDDHRDHAVREIRDHEAKPASLDHSAGRHG